MTTRANSLYNSLTITGTGSTATDGTLYVTGKTTSEVVRSYKELTQTLAATQEGGIGTIDPSVSTYGTLLVSGTSGSHLLTTRSTAGVKQLEWKENGSIFLGNGTNNSNIMMSYRTTSLIAPTGERNIGIGLMLNSNTYNDCIAIGTSNSQGINNNNELIAFGTRACFSVQNVDRIISFGVNTSRSTASVTNDANDSIYLGREAGRFMRFGRGVVAGSLAGRGASTADYAVESVALGRASMRNAKSGYTVAIGGNSSFGNSGIRNVTIGDNAAINNDFFVSFNDVVIIGDEVGIGMSGSSNVIVGKQAGSAFVDEGSVFIGVFSSRYGTSARSVGIGTSSSRELSGIENVIIGHQSGEHLDGNYNTLFGAVAIHYNTGDNNIFIGANNSSDNIAAATGGTALGFDGTNINVSNQTITITSHGLEIGKLYNFYYSQGTTNIGFTDGSSQKFEVIDANILRKWGPDPANTSYMFDALSNNTGTGHMLSPYVSNLQSDITSIYSNVGTTSIVSGGSSVLLGSNAQTGLTLGFALPLYTNDIAAIADTTLPSNSLYRANTVPNQIRIKP